MFNTLLPIQQLTQHPTANISPLCHAGVAECKIDSRKHYESLRLGSGESPRSRPPGSGVYLPTNGSASGALRCFTAVMQCIASLKYVLTSVGIQGSFRNDGILSGFAVWASFITNKGHGASNRASSQNEGGVHFFWFSVPKRCKPRLSIRSYHPARSRRKPSCSLMDTHAEHTPLGFYLTTGETKTSSLPHLDSYHCLGRPESEDLISLNLSFALPSHGTKR